MGKTNKRSVTAIVGSKSFTIHIRTKDTAVVIAKKLNEAVTKEFPLVVDLFSASSAVKRF